MTAEETNAFVEELQGETAEELEGSAAEAPEMGEASEALEADEVEEEAFELEYSEDDIYAYIVDEDDNEIGFIILDEDGTEQEYYYAEDEVEPSDASAESDDEFDLGITREGVAAATADMNAIYRDGIEVAAELKGAYDDIMGGLGFLKKK